MRGEGGARSSSRQYRRSPGLVFYWNESALECFNCISGRRYAVVPEVVHFLDHLGERTTMPDIDVTTTLKGLERLGFVERARTEHVWPWQPWMPEAAFFHFGTRGGNYPADPREQDVELRAKAVHSPAPSPTKTTSGRRRSLPSPKHLGSFTDILKARRTWRNFSDAPIPAAALATLLQLTWGVQRRGTVPGQGRVVLKTSPSGGARHPIEAYVLAANVESLPARAYHYDADTHELVDLRRRIDASLVERLLANQDYYRGAAAVIVMTAVIARSMWKYPRSRAYRTILADAGHLGQTFCLAATAMGLAPFCTMAFREAEVEHILRVDGVAECAMYVVGVGSQAPDHASRPGRISRRQLT